MVRLGVEYRSTADGFSKGTVHRQMWTSTIMGPTCSRLASSIEQWSMMELGFCERLLLPFAAQLFPELNLAIQTCTDEAFTLLPSRQYFFDHTSLHHIAARWHALDYAPFCMILHVHCTSNKCGVCFGQRIYLEKLCINA